MQCVKCGKTDKVTVGARQYCANCGDVIGHVPVATRPHQTATTPTVTTPAAPAIAPVQPGPAIRKPTMADLSPVLTKAATAAPQTATRPTAKPSLFGKLFKKPASSASSSITLNNPAAPTSTAASASTSNQSTINPAKTFHSTPNPAPPAALNSPPTQTAAPDASAAPAAPISPALATAGIAKTKTSSSRADKASAIGQNNLIKKFGPQPAHNAGQPITAPPAAAKPNAPLVQTQPNPAPARPASIDPSDSRTEVEPAPALPPIPNSVLSQTESLKRLLPTTEKALPAPRGLAGLKPSSVAAAAVAIAIMGGYIWVKNYPNYALKVASDQAGFEASLPNYLPSSYALAGSIAAGVGQISLNFHSPSDGPFTLTQAKTNWDSGSLLENYVSQKTDKYLAVPNHGLTVYLYNGNQASWVNHGIWYTLEGSTHLSRDQVFKIINSL